MKTLIKKRLLGFLRNKLPWNSKLSCSQFGEDIALLSLLGYYGFKTGTYVDIGAFHPVWLSNTYAFYQQGWRGVTIDPNPTNAKLFREVRPLDTHYTQGIAPVAGDLTFYNFGANSPMNTFSQELAENVGKPFTKQTVPCMTLNQVLDKHGPVTLLCLDCEGLDEPILESVDWGKHLPFTVVSEQEGATIDEVMASSTYSLLHSHGYDLFAKIGPTLIFHQLDPSNWR